MCIQIFLLFLLSILFSGLQQSLRIMAQDFRHKTLYAILYWQFKKSLRALLFFHVGFLTCSLGTKSLTKMRLHLQRFHTLFIVTHNNPKEQSRQILSVFWGWVNKAENLHTQSDKLLACCLLITVPSSLCFLVSDSSSDLEGSHFAWSWLVVVVPGMGKKESINVYNSLILLRKEMLLRIKKEDPWRRWDIEFMS